jgi:hypothetical protein
VHWLSQLNNGGFSRIHNCIVSQIRGYATLDNFPLTVKASGFLIEERA